MNPDSLVPANENSTLSAQDRNRTYAKVEYERLASGGAYEPAPTDQSGHPEAILQKLYRLFDLSPSAIDYTLACVATVFNAKLPAAQENAGVVSILRVTPAYLQKAFNHSDQDWADFCFGSNELFEFGLLFYDTDEAFNASELERPIRVHPRLIRFLTGAVGLPVEVMDFLGFAGSQGGEGGLPADIQPALNHIRDYLKQPDRRAVLHFYGPDGTGKSRAAEFVCKSVQSPCFAFDIRPLLRRPERLEGLLQLVGREARLFEAAVLIRDWHLLKNQPQVDADLILRRLQSQCGFVILTSEEPFYLPRKEHPVIDLEFTAADHSQRVASWTEHLNGDVAGGQLTSLESVAGLYKFNDGQIRSIVQRAKIRSLAVTGEDHISDKELIAGCREESSQKLSELATKIATRHSWEFLILPEDQKVQLRELCDHMKYRAKVYEDWAYHTRVAAPGLNALFTGPPGTGKTLAASIIAHELGIDLYKIDLSTIVSKYVGETEKNLSQIFDEAEAANAILFFDEADSLFGKRSAVNDAHDRYANIQVGYLLQKMEEFPGMTILASNLIENIDDAFMRRLHFSVDFPFPAAPEREKIWRISFPEQAPLADNISFEQLGKRIKIPGGNIRNIALHAAFHAAADDGLITAKHIAKAARREYEKEGRSLNS